MTATKRSDMKSANRSLIFILIILLLLGAAFAGLHGAGRWLVREDPLARADVIFVLSGGLPARAEEAGRFFTWATRLKCGSAGQLVLRTNCKG